MASRTFGLYFSWSQPRESGASLEVLDNRYPALFEFRRLQWPRFERLNDPARYKQGIEGFLEHVIIADFRHFRDVIERETGNPVRLVHREEAGSPVAQLDKDFFGPIDTLIIPSLDHIKTAQQASAGEIEVIG